MSDKRYLPLRVDSEIVDMYDQVIKVLNDQRELNEPALTRQKMFANWVKSLWATHVATHKLDVQEYSIYFPSEEAKHETEHLINGYLDKGMKVDSQLIEYICERTQGYAVQRVE